VNFKKFVQVAERLIHELKRRGVVGPGWEEDRELVDAEIETAFGTLDPAGRMSAAEVEASWKSKCHSPAATAI